MGGDSAAFQPHVITNDCKGAAALEVADMDLDGTGARPADLGSLMRAPRSLLWCSRCLLLHPLLTCAGDLDVLVACTANNSIVW